MVPHKTVNGEDTVPWARRWRKYYSVNQILVEESQAMFLYLRPLTCNKRNRHVTFFNKRLCLHTHFPSSLQNMAASANNSPRSVELYVQYIHIVICRD